MWKIAAKTIYTAFKCSLFTFIIYKMTKIPYRFKKKLFWKLHKKLYYAIYYMERSRAMHRWAALNLAMQMQGSDLKKTVAFLMDVNRFGRCSFRRIFHEYDNWGHLSYHYDKFRREEVFKIVRTYGHCTNRKPLLKARDVFGL